MSDSYEFLKAHYDRIQAAQTPEPSLPLSAIRALIQQWRERIAVCRRISKERAAEGEMLLAQAWHAEADHLEDCTNDLERLCPAPAAEEETR